MYKISHEVINFIEKTMKTWRVELTAEGRSFSEAKVQRDMPQEGVMMPLNNIHRKFTAGHKLTKSQKKNQ